MQNFEASYKELNEEQKRAVDHVNGPLLVVAGPGTGKTQLLSLRAAQILRKTDSSASNILCLTYTNKAAINMKQRLLALIGPEANSITVKTFHSFAADIINNYPSYFWNGAALRPIPETRQLEIMETILSEFPLSHPMAMKFSGQFTLVDTVIKAIAITKEAGLTPGKLRSIIELNNAYINEIEEELASILEPRLTEKKYPEIIEKISNLKSMDIKDSIAPMKPLDEIIKESFERAINQQLAGKKSAVSAWKAKWLTNVDGIKKMSRERNHNAWWLALCDVYETYQNVTQKQGFYDLSDMIIEVIRAIETIPDLRSEIQEQYTHVMIDEFQDTNLAQGRLSHLIADHYANEGRPNIMAVGDDDQTIYRFQGAELNNMRAFIDLYSADVIVLTKNYRSSQEILDFSKIIIDKAESRLVNLIDGLTKNLVSSNQIDGEINYLSFKTKESQYQHLVDKALEYSKHGEVAILARKHESLVNISQFFKSKDADISYEQQANLLDDDIVRLIMQISGAIVAIHEGDVSTSDAFISEFIRHEAWGIDHKTLWNFAIQNRKKPDWLNTLLECDDQNISNIGHWLLWLSTIASSEPAIITLEYIIGLKAGEHLTSPIITYVKDKNRVIKSLSALNHFKKLVLEYGSRKATLKDFYNMTTRLENNNKMILDNSIYVGGGSPIELLTVHKSKGLEFDTVIIVDAIEKHWSPSRNNTERTPPSNLPLKRSGDEADDFVRLLYVAATRAKKNLIITNYEFNENGELQQPSSILTGAAEASLVETDSVEKIEDQLINILEWPRLDIKDEKSLLRPILEEYRLSATQLTTFLDVSRGGPKNFLEKNLLKLPTPHSDKMAFGRAIHKSLEIAQHNSSKNAFDIGSTITAFEEALDLEPMSNSSYERYIVHGKDVLSRLFGNLNFKIDPDATAEQKVDVVTDNNVRLTGKLDVIHVANESMWFDDYKTGKPLPNIDSRSKNSEKAWKQRYQIIFYSILLKSSPQFAKNKLSPANMIYVEAENPKDLKRSYLPSSEDIEQVNKLINIVWQHILDLNFPDTSNYESNYYGIKKFCEDLLDGKI